ncbi:hypothetical protein ACTXHA_03990 [Burkholderia cenocepacia]
MANLIRDHSLFFEGAGMVENVIELVRDGPGVFEETCRRAFVDPKLKRVILEATGWHETMLNKVLNGAGVTFDKTDAVCRATGLTIVEVDYMEYLMRGNLRGAQCRCARASLGACGGAY